MKNFNTDLPDFIYGNSYNGLGQSTGLNSQNLGFGEKNTIISDEVLIKNFNILNLNKGDFVLNDLNGIGINIGMLKIFSQLNNDYLKIIDILTIQNNLVIKNNLTKINPGLTKY